MNVKTKKLGNGITNVIINDPKTYNSLSFKTLKDLLNTFTRLDKDDNTRVIILEGSGKGFSAGHNLKEVGGIKNNDIDRKIESWSLMNSYTELIWAMYLKKLSKGLIKEKYLESLMTNIKQQTL